MKILCPVKRVVDPYAKVRALADGSGLDIAGVKFDVNPFDEIAIEEAVRMKERTTDIEITAVSIGPADCEEQLRKALAMGVDKAILIESSDPYDSLSIAAMLAEIANDLKPDIILMGKQSTDVDRNQVGQMLAAKLDWPQATFASKIEVSGNTMRVTRETDTGEETLEVPMPCVVTADLRLNEPRYIALPGIIKARSKPLEKRSASLATPKVRTLRFDQPDARPPGRKVATVQELVAALKERGAL